MKSPAERYFNIGKPQGRFNAIYNATAEALDSNYGRYFLRQTCVGFSDRREESFHGQAHPEANGKYEAWTMPHVERAVEATLASLFEALNALYPAGEFKWPGKRLRITPLGKAKSPVYWGYAKIPFTYQGSAYYARYFENYVRRAKQKRAQKTYESYPYAPTKFCTALELSVSHRRSWIKLNNTPRLWPRGNTKSNISDISENDFHILYRILVACIAQWHQFLVELRRGDHTTSLTIDIEMSGPNAD